MLRHVRLLIFDLDYLIFDCSSLRMQALRRSLLAFADAIPHSIRLPDVGDLEEGYRMRGREWFDGLQMGLKEEQIEDLAQTFRVHQQRLIEAGVGSLFPGVEDLLSTFRSAGLTLCLGADAEREYLLKISDRQGLYRYFDVSFCADEFGSGELWEMFEESMHRAGVNPSETLALGTRARYFHAAHSLDIMTVGCGWGLQNQTDLAEAALQCMEPGQTMSAVSRMDLHAWKRFS